MLEYCKKTVIAGLGALLLLGSMAKAEYVFEWTEGRNITLGADLRVRLTAYDRAVLNQEDPNLGQPGSKEDSVDYLRLRTRIWAKVDLMEGLKLNARIVNRSHEYSSHPSNPNENGGWEFFDEIIFDQLNFQLIDILADGLTITIGRQDLALGNGMVFLEGTPGDQGRTIYNDGISARYKGEKNTVTAFAFYNRQRDPYVLQDDQDRNLSRGNIFTTGLYWTYNCCEKINTDLYYIFAHVAGDGNSPYNRGADIHTIGARVFGSLHEQVDYSAEFAQQISQYDVSPASSDHKNVMGDGCMIDLRLTFKAPEDTTFDPSLMMQYTYFSGDDSGSKDYNGWDPIFDAYPIYRDELIPILLRGGDWSNLHIFRGELKLKLTKKVCLTTSVAHLMADEADVATAASGGGAGGRTLGQLYNAFLDYKMNKYLKFSLQGSFLDSGSCSYWSKGEDAKWLRFETTITF